MSQQQVEGYQVLRQLGSGTYGQVWEAIEIATSRRCAVKILTFESEDEGVPSTLMREISALKDLSHENIVSLLAIQLPTTRQVNLVFEFCEMDLKGYMTERKRSTGLSGLGVDVTRVLLFQLVRGMAYCHSKGYMHRDLKPQNLLVNVPSDGTFPQLKIADFGLSRATTIPVKKFVEKVVTLWYRAPELLLGETKYTTAIDVWSIGCIFAEMATGNPFLSVPRNGHEEDELRTIITKFGKPKTDGPQGWPQAVTLKNASWLNSVSDCPPQPLPVDHLNAFGIDLLTRMMTWNPEHRITCEAALHHPYFKDLPHEILQVAINERNQGNQ